MTAYERGRDCGQSKFEVEHHFGRGPEGVLQRLGEYQTLVLKEKSQWWRDFYQGILDAITELG